jgi:hypothetical protein
VAEEPETRIVKPRSVKILAVAVVALFGILFALNSGDRRQAAPGVDLLFPELTERLNDLNMVTITDADGTITVRRDGAGRWVVPENGGYAANTGTLRQLLLALADARKVEEKTANPDLYERLGVLDPRGEGNDEGSGVLVSARGDDAAISVILGDAAQREFRYARIPEQPESWLIDQNPTIPEDPGGWLSPDIVDIDAAEIQSVAIRHSDGEVLRIRKENANESNFVVEGIPEGRELSYPTVANSIAGVLTNLTLEDVTAGARPEEEATTTVDFTTFDGLQLSVSVFAEDGEADGEESGQQHWITLLASANPPDDQEEVDEKDVASEAAEASDTSDTSTSAEEQSSAEESEQSKDPAEVAAGINERVSGWAYRIPEYKANQLTRRWEDILSDPGEDEQP